MLRNICLSFMFCILSSVAFADATAILNEPEFADLKKHPGAEDVLKHFTDKDQLYYAVDKLGPDEFVNRFAHYNKEAGLDIYQQVRNSMQQPAPIHSIYDGQVEPEQEPPDEHKNIDIRIVFACVILIVILFLWFKS